MRFGGFVVAAMVLLAACSSDPAPKEPRVTSTASSATPSRPLPTMPPQASEDSPEGAAAFVKHYVDVFNYAAATGDVEELSRLSSPDCDGCQSYIQLYKKTYEAGGYFRGGDWTVSRVEVEQSPNTRRVFVHVESDSGSQSTARGASDGPTTPEDTDVIFVVTRSHGDGAMQITYLARSEP